MYSLTRGFVCVLDTFEQQDVRFLVVGSYATAALAQPRYVKDLDLLVERSEANAQRVVAALEMLGFGELVSVEDFLTNTVIELGYSPVLVDLMSSGSHPAFSFAAEHARRTDVRVDGTLFPLAHRQYHIEVKRVRGRTQDLEDVAALEEGDPLLRSTEERIREVERLRRNADLELLGDPERSLARAVRRKSLRTL